MVVSEKTMAAIHEQARAAYPEECCGMVVERGGGLEVVPIENVQNELHALDPEQFPRTAATAYSMRYSDVEPLFEGAYRGELRLVAVYHSHPDHDAYFSEQDRAAADGWVDDPNYAEAVQFVVSVRQGEVKDTKMFLFDGATRSYVPGDFEILPDAGAVG